MKKIIVITLLFSLIAACSARLGDIQPIEPTVKIEKYDDTHVQVTTTYKEIIEKDKLLRIKTDLEQHIAELQAALNDVNAKLAVLE